MIEIKYYLKIVKKLLFFFIFSTVFLLAQDETQPVKKTDEDTVSFIFRYMKVILISEFKTPQEIQKDWVARHKKRPSRYIGIGIGMSGFLSTKTGINFSGETSIFNLDYSKSVHVQLNFLAYKFRLTSDLGIATGMGFNFDHFVFQIKNKQRNLIY